MTSGPGATLRYGDSRSPKRILTAMSKGHQKWYPIAKDVAEVALGVACMGFLHAANLAYVVIDEVAYRRTHPEWKPYGGHGDVTIRRRVTEP